MWQYRRVWSTAEKQLKTHACLHAHSWSISSKTRKRGKECEVEREGGSDRHEARQRQGKRGGREDETKRKRQNTQTPTYCTVMRIRSNSEEYRQTGKILQIWGVSTRIKFCAYFPRAVPLPALCATKDSHTLKNQHNWRRVLFSIEDSSSNSIGVSHDSESNHFLLLRQRRSVLPVLLSSSVFSLHALFLFCFVLDLNVSFRCSNV